MLLTLSASGKTMGFFFVLNNNMHTDRKIASLCGYCDSLHEEHNKNKSWKAPLEEQDIKIKASRL